MAPFRLMDTRSRYQVPDGLRPLLEALARETLRAQPDDVIKFASIFFDELQRQRKCESSFLVVWFTSDFN